MVSGDCCQVIAGRNLTVLIWCLETRLVTSLVLAVVLLRAPLESKNWIISMVSDTFIKNMIKIWNAFWPRECYSYHRTKVDSGLSCKCPVVQEVLFPVKPRCQQVANLNQRLETQGAVFLAKTRLCNMYNNMFWLHAGLIFGWSYFPSNLQARPNRTHTCTQFGFCAK